MDPTLALLLPLVIAAVAPAADSAVAPAGDGVRAEPVSPAPPPVR